MGNMKGRMEAFVKIVVLAGGISTEREVSLVSGKGICQALRKKGHEAVLLDMFYGYDDKGAGLSDVFEKESLIDSEIHDIDVKDPDISKIMEMRDGKHSGLLGINVLNICNMADIVFLGLHGADGENGKLQAIFDIAGIKYTGSGPLGSALAMDKEIAKKVLRGGKIPVPSGFLLNKREIEENGLSGCQCPAPSFPCVVKPCSGGSSVGVSIANNNEEYKKALDTAFKYEDEVLVEEYIKGRELSVAVLDGKALPVIEIVPKEGFYDYKTKYQKGMAAEVCPAQIDEKIAIQMQNFAEKAYKLLKLDVYARVDFLLDGQENIYCLEANTLPGMTPLSLLPQEAAAVGISYEELCEKITGLSMQKKTMFYNKITMD